MNYYPFHIGDYVAHTAHLDPIEDCAYRRLLDAYYMAESALPADVAVCARLIRMKSNVADVEQVLGEFFVLTESGWTHKRCDAEICAFKTKAEAARTNGLRGGRPKKQSEKPKNNPEVFSGFVNQNPNQPSGKLTKNQEPIANNQYPPNPPQGDSQGEGADDLDDEVLPLDDVLPEDRTPTPQGAACMAMKSVGISDVNPHHSQLIALLDSGVPLETFVAVSRDCLARGKGSFRYILSVVERQELEARDLATQLAKERFATVAAETDYQRSMRERMQEAVPEIARKAPGEVIRPAREFFDAQVIEVQAKQMGGGK